MPEIDELKARIKALEQAVREADILIALEYAGDYNSWRERNPIIDSCDLYPTLEEYQVGVWRRQSHV